MKGFLGIFLFSVLGTAPAQTVIVKCRDARGAVIYQTHACDEPAGEQPISLKRYDALRDDPYAAAQVREAQLQQDRQSQMRGSGNVHYIRSDGRENPSACDAAKAHREATLKAVGMRRNFDLLRALDENVQGACK